MPPLPDPILTLIIGTAIVAVGTGVLAGLAVLIQRAVLRRHRREHGGHD